MSAACVSESKPLAALITRVVFLSVHRLVVLRSEKIMAGWIVSHCVYYLFELPPPLKRLSPFFAPVAASHGTVEGSTALPNEAAWRSCQRFALMAASHVHAEAGRAGQLLPTSFYGTLNRSAKLQVFWRRMNLPVLSCHDARKPRTTKPRPPCTRQYLALRNLSLGGSG